MPRFRAVAGTVVDAPASPPRASLTAAGGPVPLNSSTYDAFLSSNGNVAPELSSVFAAEGPRQARWRHRPGTPSGDALYEEDALDAFKCSATTCAGHPDHTLSQTLTQRVSENVSYWLAAWFYDNALEAFAIAIDVKHVNIQGHSLRVGRYAQAIGEAIGMDAADVASLRSAAYLHDIGMVAIDSVFSESLRNWMRTNPRDAGPHGHWASDRQQVQFPWRQIPEIVRWHTNR